MRGWRPGTDWAGATMLGVLTAAGAGTDVDQWNLSNVFTADTPDPAADFPETLRRTRGWWHAYVVTWPGGPAPGEVEVALGLCVAPDGATLRSPLLDSGWDGWLWRDWAYWRLPGQFNSATIPSSNMSNVTQHGDSVLDSRAMRKLEDNHLLLVVELGTDTGAAVAVNYIVDVRCLFSPTPKS